MAENQNPEEHGLGESFVAGAISFTLVGITALIYNLYPGFKVPEGNTINFQNRVCIYDEQLMNKVIGRHVPELKKDCDETYSNETAICELNYPSQYEFDDCIHKRSEEWRACLNRERDHALEKTLKNPPYAPSKR